MNVSEVKNSINNHQSWANQIASELYHIANNTNIAMFDSEDEIKNTYRAEMSKICDKFVKLLNLLVNDINKAMETEIDTVLLAKNQTVNTLNG